jgi:hypothetical protein
VAEAAVIDRDGYVSRALYFADRGDYIAALHVMKQWDQKSASAHMAQWLRVTITPDEIERQRLAWEAYRR